MKIRGFFSADFTTHFATTLALITTLGAIQPSSAGAATLEDIYQKTLQRSESIAVQKILVEQSANNLSRARSKLGPQLNAGGNYTYQGRDGQSNLETSTLTRVGLSQPLFRGGALTNGIAIANIDLSRAKTAEEQTRWNIWWTLTQAYYNVLRAEKALANYEELEGVLQRRQNEINRRVQLGRSRRADQATTIGQRQTALAAIEQLRAQVQVGRLFLQQMSGIADLGKLEVPAPAVSATRNDPQMDSRPDIQLRILNEKRAKEEVDFIEGNLWPELSLVGNYYPYRNDSFATFQNSLRWDAGVQLTWTLDLEELNLTQRRDRELNRQAEELRLAESRRLTTEEFQRRLTTLGGTQKQYTELGKAVEASDRAWKALQADYRNGTIGLLEVVQQENLYWESKRAYDNLKFDIDLLSWEVLWLEGKAPTDLKGTAE
ncbi:MAG: TolC family protein [Bdellovibrionaceae bacterium]|nr:TolC family protein [Pseudobdellovibrionaceae bacterium]